MRILLKEVHLDFVVSSSSIGAVAVLGRSVFKKQTTNRRPRAKPSNPPESGAGYHRHPT